MTTVARPALPVTLMIGDITVAEIGTVPIPLIAGPVSKDPGGQKYAEFHVDHAEFRRGVADLLRAAAAEFERGPVDDE